MLSATINIDSFEITCPICQDYLVSPISYQCGHNVCKLCNFQIQNHKCPMCRSQFNKKNIDTNKLLSKLLSGIIENYSDLVKDMDTKIKNLENLKMYYKTKRSKTIKNLINEYLNEKLFVSIDELISNFCNLNSGSNNYAEIEIKLILRDKFLSCKTEKNIIIYQKDLHGKSDVINKIHKSDLFNEKEKELFIINLIKPMRQFYLLTNKKLLPINNIILNIDELCVWFKLMESTIKEDIQNNSHYESSDEDDYDDDYEDDTENYDSEDEY